MADQKMKESGTHRGLSQAVVDLAQGDEGAIGDALDTDAAEVELTLSDLVGDANGEIVIFNDSGSRTLAIRTHAVVVADGQVAKRTTATGEDVSGFRYVTFDNGMTLYFQEDLDLILRSDPPGARP